MSIQIRPVLEADIEAIHGIEMDAHLLPWSKKIIKDCYLVGYDFNLIESFEEDHSQIIGYIIVRSSNNMAHILNLCIAKPFQSLGYGRFLLEETLKRYEQDGLIDYVVLEVRPSNKVALNLYRSLKFDTLEIKKNYYNIGEHQEDAIVLRKILNTSSN